MKRAMFLLVLGGEKQHLILSLMPWLSHCGSDELGKSQNSRFTGHFIESMPWHFMAS